VILMDGDMAVPSDFVSAHVRSHSDSCSAIFGTRHWVFLRDVRVPMGLERVVRLLLSDCKVPLYTDVSFQQKYAASPYPWLGCMACNFSFVRAAGVLFDERFGGWGTEDQEFACRLKVRYGYSLIFAPSIAGLHLDNGSISEYSSVRPKTHDEIGRYVKNVLYFKNAYPTLEMTSACNGLGFFELDQSTQKWTLARQPCFDTDHIKDQISRAEKWVALEVSVFRRKGPRLFKTFPPPVSSLT
jgi:hypothetical protein